MKLVLPTLTWGVYIKTLVVYLRSFKHIATEANCSERQGNVFAPRALEESVAQTIGENIKGKSGGRTCAFGEIPFSWWRKVFWREVLRSEKHCER